MNTPRSSLKDQSPMKNLPQASYIPIRPSGLSIHGKNGSMSLSEKRKRLSGKLNEGDPGFAIQEDGVHRKNNSQDPPEFGKGSASFQQASIEARVMLEHQEELRKMAEIKSEGQMQMRRRILSEANTPASSILPPRPQAKTPEFVKTGKYSISMNSLCQKENPGSKEELVSNLSQNISAEETEARKERVSEEHKANPQQRSSIEFEENESHFLHENIDKSNVHEKSDITDKSHLQMSSGRANMGSLLKIKMNNWDSMTSGSRKDLSTEIPLKFDPMGMSNSPVQPASAHQEPKENLCSQEVLNEIEETSRENSIQGHKDKSKKWKMLMDSREEAIGKIEEIQEPDFFNFDGCE
jgi:hypothetical protein